MSTAGSPYGELPPTDEAAVALDVKDRHEHHWFAEPTKPVTWKYATGLVFARFVFFVALLGPAVALHRRRRRARRSLVVLPIKNVR
jgi:hypothetical protein